MSVRLRTFEERDYWLAHYRGFVRCAYMGNQASWRTIFPEAMAYADRELLRYRQNQPIANCPIAPETPKALDALRVVEIEALMARVKRLEAENLKLRIQSRTQRQGPMLPGQIRC